MRGLWILVSGVAALACGGNAGELTSGDGTGGECAGDECAPSSGGSAGTASGGETGSSGGATGTGGAVATGGATAGGSGGSPHTGGGAGAGGGAATGGGSSGGAVATGGTSSGGTVSTGGAATGGTSSGGGTGATGGAPPNYGFTAEPAECLSDGTRYETKEGVCMFIFREDAGDMSFTDCAVEHTGTPVKYVRRGDSLAGTSVEISGPHKYILYAPSDATESPCDLDQELVGAGSYRFVFPTERVLPGGTADWGGKPRCFELTVPSGAFYECD